MKYDFLKLISIGSIIICAALNYSAFIPGSSASWISGYVFFIFILLWIAIIYMSRNNIPKLKMILIIWSICAISSIVLILANLDINLDIFSWDWFIPICLIFNGALYGITYWIDSNLIVASIHLLISIVFIITAVIFFINERRKQMK